MIDTNYERNLKALNDYIKHLEEENNAMELELAYIGECDTCKLFNPNTGEHKCYGKCKDNYIWRGIDEFEKFHREQQILEERERKCGLY